MSDEKMKAVVTTVVDALISSGHMPDKRPEFKTSQVERLVAKFSEWEKEKNLDHRLHRNYIASWCGNLRRIVPTDVLNEFAAYAGYELIWKPASGKVLDFYVIGVGDIPVETKSVEDIGVKVPE